MKLPSLEKEIPKELFAKFWIPAMNSVMVLSFILKFYQFGNDEKEFSLVGGLMGAFLFAIVTLITAYITGSRTIGSYVRFLIIYQRHQIGQSCTVAVMTALMGNTGILTSIRNVKIFING